MLKIQGIRARGGAMSFLKGFCTFCKFIPSPTTYQFCSRGISPYPEKSDRKGVRTEKMGGDARARSWESGGMLIEELRGTCATGGLTTNGLGALAGVSGPSGVVVACFGLVMGSTG